MYHIAIDDLRGDDVAAFLAEHLRDMFSTSPAESVHALDLDGLRKPEITFWTLRDDSRLLGTAALKQLDPAWAEIKSMRTAGDRRGEGLGSMLVDHLLDVARSRGYRKLSLETGTQDYFAPARRLYERHGFSYGEPFADYWNDPNSAFMHKDL